MNRITAINMSDESLLENNGRLSEIFQEFNRRPDDLIPILQKVQGTLGYLPEKALLEVAFFTRLPPAKVFGVVMFYSQFRLQPVGKHIIRVCRGTACHVRGSGRILSDIMAMLHVAPGETTRDRIFTLETVACFGSCALAPVVVIDDSVYGRMSSPKVKMLLNDIRAKEEKSTFGDSNMERSGGQNGLLIHEGQGL